MDPSDEPVDDDLFADLYGDDEPAKPRTEPIKPAEPAVPAAPTQVQSKPAPEVTTPETSVPVQAAQKAVDPRVPPQSAAPAQQYQQSPQQPHQQTQSEVADQYSYDGAHDYQGWDAASAGQDMGDNKGYDPMGGMNGGYGDIQGTGSPAIKEDGKMFIGGLNWETTDESLKDYFSQFGEVTECTVMRDGPTGRSRGFGFLTFKDPKTVNIVMVKEHYLDGKIIDPKRAIPRDEQEKTSKIFVGGVSQEANESDFREYFTQFGRVLDSTLMIDKDTGRPRGFGFVTFDSEGAVENALACSNLEILGKPIEVKKAQPRGNIRERMNAHFDDRDDRSSFRDRGNNRDRFEARDNSSGNFGNAQQPQANVPGAGAYNGLTPQMMAQYWQNMQRYMQAMGSFGRGAGPMPAVNPAMMQQAMQSMTAGGGMAPQMMQQLQNMQQMQMRQQMQPQGSPSPMGGAAGPQQPPQAGYGGNGAAYGAGAQQAQQGYDGGGGGYNDMQQQAARNQQYGRAGNFQNHPSQRDYQPPQQHPSSWEGMYDDVPPQQVQQMQMPQQVRTGTPNVNPAGGPPPNAPTGPKNQKPGSNYRGGGRGGAAAGRNAGYGGYRGGYHPYAR